MNPERFRLYLPTVAALAHLRPLSLAYRLAAHAARRLAPRADELAVVSAHMQRCAQALGGEARDLDRWLRQYSANIGVASLNTFLFRTMTPAWIGRQIRLEGEHHLRTALAQGRGALILTAHQHHLVFLGVALGLLGLQIHPILLDPALTVPPFLQAYMDRMLGDSERRFNGGRYLLVDLRSRFVRPIHRVLAGGGIVVSASDFPSSLAPKRRLICPFLGQHVSIPYGSIQLAHHYRTPLLTAFLHWQGGDRFVLRFATLKGTTLEESVCTYAQHLQRCVRDDPSGWEGWKWADLFVP